MTINENGRGRFEGRYALRSGSTLAAAPTAALLLGLSACGAPPSDTATTTEAFSVATCANTPDKTFTGEIEAPDSGVLRYSNPSQHLSDILKYYANVGLITPETYSNRSCSYGYVVRVNGWLDPLADFVVAAHNNPTPIGGVSKADCESLYLAAVAYSADSNIISHNGDSVCNGTICDATSITRVAGGVYSTWVDSIGLTHADCTPPKVVFGGESWRDGDYDRFPGGGNIVVAATYRTTVGSTITTHALSIFNSKGTCGHVGEACCTANALNPWCGQENTQCDSGICNTCGEEGYEWCGSNGNKLCFAENLQPSGSICAKCGGNSQPCCHNVLYPNAPACGNGLSCQNKEAKCLPTPVPPATPPVTPVASLPKCNGQMATNVTEPHAIMVQNSVTACGDLVLERADSDVEAQACARAQGWTVLTGSQSLQEYPFCVCSFGGAGTMTVPAYSQDAANSCVTLMNIGAFNGWAGACTQDEIDACANL